MAMPAGGLMGAPEDPVEGQASEDEQAAMLGVMADEPVEEEQLDGPLA